MILLPPQAGCSLWFDDLHQYQTKQSASHLHASSTAADDVPGFAMLRAATAHHFPTNAAVKSVFMVYVRCACSLYIRHVPVIAPRR